jgi:hypothetical protein
VKVMPKSALCRYVVGLALKPKEQGLSSSAVPRHRNVRKHAALVLALCAFWPVAPLVAQDAKAAGQEQPQPPAPPRDRINLMVTKPRGEVNAAQVQECVERADAGSISGEIVVCRQVGDDPANLYSSPEEARKRYAEATANKAAPRTPDFINDCKDQGNPFGCMGFGRTPPVALMIDVSALPQAPVGSDADRIARGLPPLNQELELSEEQEKARREAMGVKFAPEPLAPPPSTPKKKKR